MTTTYRVEADWTSTSPQSIPPEAWTTLAYGPVSAVEGLQPGHLYQVYLDLTLRAAWSEEGQVVYRLLVNDENTLTFGAQILPARREVEGYGEPDPDDIDWDTGLPWEHSNPLYGSLIGQDQRLQTSASALLTSAFEAQRISAQVFAGPGVTLVVEQATLRVTSSQSE